MHEVAHLQGRQRAELAEPERLAGIIGLEEDGGEAVVRDRCAVDRPAAEGNIPDAFAAGPELVAVGVGTFGKLRPLDEVVDAFALIGEGEVGLQIGDGLDVVGLQPVVGVDIVGVLADDGADDVDRVDAVVGRDSLDLAAQLPVVFQERVDLPVLALEGGVVGAGAPGRGAGNRGLLGGPVSRRHEGLSRRGQGRRDEQDECRKKSPKIHCQSAAAQNPGRAT